jgi:hypothetical protein
LLDIAVAPTAREAWLCQRKYAAKVLEYVYVGGGGGVSVKGGLLRSWRRSLFRQTREDRFQRDVLALFWWLRITNARMEGALPAWEGIRVVREVPSETVAADSGPA